MTRTVVWFMLSDEQQNQFLQDFIRVDKLDMAAIYPVPNRVVNTKTWTRKYWGTSEPLVPVTIDYTCLSIVTEQCPSSDWFLKLFAVLGSPELTVVSASDTLGLDIVGFSIVGEEIIPRDIKYPVRLACAVWGIDYLDYLCKVKVEKRNAVLASEVNPNEDDDGDEVLLFLEGIGEPICQDV